METCIICVEKLTEKKKMTCPFCDFVCCKACVGKYILSIQDDANCMNCHQIGRAHV